MSEAENEIIVKFDTKDDLIYLDEIGKWFTRRGIVPKIGEGFLITEDTNEDQNELFKIELGLSGTGLWRVTEVFYQPLEDSTTIWVEEILNE